MADEKQDQSSNQIDPESIVFPPRSLEPIMGSAAPKREWPELVGLTKEESESKIKEDMPRAVVQAVPVDCFVTMDFNQRRVRLRVDSSGKVVHPPRIG